MVISMTQPTIFPALKGTASTWYLCTKGSMSADMRRDVAIELIKLQQNCWYVFCFLICFRAFFSLFGSLCGEQKVITHVQGRGCSPFLSSDYHGRAKMWSDRHCRQRSITQHAECDFKKKKKNLKNAELLCIVVKCQYFVIHPSRCDCLKS